MYYGEIKDCDIANGEGVRVSLFVSGCTNHCEHCFQPQTWAFDYGQPFTEETEDRLLSLLSPSYVNGLTLLGGEPFEPANQSAVLELLERVREELPQKTVWCWSGFLFEALADGRVGAHSRSLLEQLDVLVDGPFVLAKKDLGLRFRGSSNQRIIDVPGSLAAGEVRLAEEFMQ